MRLDLAQADDARRFSTTASSSTSSTSSLDGTAGGTAGSGSSTAAGSHEARMDALTRRLGAALVQQPGRPASLAEQVGRVWCMGLHALGGGACRCRGAGW